MKVANSTEFLTRKADIPTSGARMETRCFDSWYVGEFTKETIGDGGSRFVDLRQSIQQRDFSC